MSLFHKIILKFNSFKARPNVRRSVWIDPELAFVPTDATIGERVKIKGNVKIGFNVFINDDAQIWGSKEAGVAIGDNVRIYTKVMIDSGGHDKNDSDFKFTTGKKIAIKDFAVLDNSCIICKGVTIGKGAIVMEGAVATANVPNYGIVQGNSAKLIGYRNYKGMKNLENE